MRSCFPSAWNIIMGTIFGTSTMKGYMIRNCKFHLISFELVILPGQWWRAAELSTKYQVLFCFESYSYTQNLNCICHRFLIAFSEERKWFLFSFFLCHSDIDIERLTLRTMEMTANRRTSRRFSSFPKHLQILFKWPFFSCEIEIDYQAKGSQFPMHEAVRFCKTFTLILLAYFWHQDKI